MTLQEAHALQRRELISLRAENKRLQKQASVLFPNEEKEALEKRIRHLENTIKTLELKHSESRKLHISRINSLVSTNRRLLDEVESLQSRVSSLIIENEYNLKRAEIAEKEVALLNGTNKRLEKKLNTNFENSSLPSSALPFRKRVPNSRKPTGKKPGGQPGHKAHEADRLTPTKEPVYIPVPDSISNNPDCYPTGKQIVKQLVDIQVIVNVTDFIADEYRNRMTGSRIHAPFPAGLTNKVNYGPSVKAFAFLLNNYYNVSIQKTKQCISDMTKGVVDLSAGTISNLSSEFSTSTEPERAKIFSLLIHSNVLYSDATVSNVNGTRKAVILCTDKKHVLYQHLEHKGHDGLTKTPVENYKGTLVHDHDKSYYSYGSNHQECIAHVLRYLIGAQENEPHLKWHKHMHALLQKMIHIQKKNKNGIPKEKVNALIQRYESILLLAEEEYTEHPPGKEYMDGYNLQKRLRAYQDSHLYFLSHPEVDPTNNISERELRKFKRKQKQAVVLRSNTGGQHICDALTIIETARTQNKNVYDTVENA
ncbi:Transposase IS66 family protein, partial [Oribacterium sp. KHPX15]